MTNKRDTRTAQVVLIVDDDSAIADAAKMLLEIEGYGVTVAASAREALGIVESGVKPDLVLSDYNLDHQSSGVELVRALREGLKVTVPAIIMSGDSLATIAPTVVSIQPCEILTKPFNADVLIDEVKKLLQSR